jgi:phage shock protein A
MTLINRVSRLFRADLHAVLDRVEEPDLLLRQAVREMEDDLAADRRRLAGLAEGRRALDARLAELEAQLAGVAEELDICFAAGKDDLARALIKRRLEGARLRDFLRAKRADLERQTAGLESRIGEHVARLEAMRQKAELLASRDPSEMPDVPWSTPDYRVRDEDVEVAFLRERQRRTVA